MKLFRWLFGLALCGVLVWFSATVELGSRTLIEHARAIAGTREAAALADGTKQEAGRVADRVQRAIARRESPFPPRQPGAPSVRTVERPVAPLPPSPARPGATHAAPGATRAGSAAPSTTKTVPPHAEAIADRTSPERPAHAQPHPATP